MCKQRFIIFSLAFTLVVLASCDKDDTGNGYIGTMFPLNGKYQSENKEVVEPAIMYVQNRQIHDTAVINSCLKRWGATSYYHINSESESFPIQNSYLTLVFGNNNLVKYTDYASVEHNAKRVASSNSEFILESEDSTLIPMSSVPFPGSESRMSILDKIVKKVPEKFYYKPGSPNYKVSFLNFPLQIINNNQLRLNVLNITVNSVLKTGPRTETVLGHNLNIWNIKNDNIENKLLNGDTVLIQNRSILLNKIP